MSKTNKKKLWNLSSASAQNLNLPIFECPVFNGYCIPLQKSGF